MTAAPGSDKSVGWCVHGCGAIITGTLQFTRETGSGAGPAYVDHAACARRPDRYRGHCVHCVIPILDSTPDVVQLDAAVAHQGCEDAWHVRRAARDQARGSR